jgi:hypothetical protein
VSRRPRVGPEEALPRARSGPRRRGLRKERKPLRPGPERVGAHALSHINWPGNGEVEQTNLLPSRHIKRFVWLSAGSSFA